MIVRELFLRNFRNVGESLFDPDPGINFLVGSNGQGKTTYLEALSYLSSLKSFRNAKNDEAVKWGVNNSTLECKVVLPNLQDWETSLRLDFEFKGSENLKASKTAFINGNRYASSTKYLSQRFGQVQLGFHSVVFNPADHDLVRGEPSLRRSYLDRVLAAEDLEYLTNLKHYQRLLKQRNSLLKGEHNPYRTQFKELLLGFTEPLANLAAQITIKRLIWLKRANIQIPKHAECIAPTQPALSLRYNSHWVKKCLENKELSELLSSGQAPLPSVELLEQAYWKQLSLLETKEFQMRTSLVGPHRDDWSFQFGQQALRGHGSQGEVRSALLALKLSEIDLFREATRHRPILLLDDFSSELDQNRRSFLLKRLEETDLQVFVTTTEDRTTIGRRYWVSNGNIGSNKKSAEQFQ